MNLMEYAALIVTPKYPKPKRAMKQRMINSLHKFHCTPEIKGGEDD